MSLPLREASDSQVSLTRIVNPLQRRIVREQVRVGWHWVTVRRHHKLVRVKRGGRLKTINVVKYVEQCTTKRVQTARHGSQVRRICRAPRVHVTKTLFVQYGHKVTLAGLYTTAEGAPLPGQPVRILAAPDNNSGAFSQIAVVTTGPNGELVGDAAARSLANHPCGNRWHGDDSSLERTGDDDRSGERQAPARLASSA